MPQAMENDPELSSWIDTMRENERLRKEIETLRKLLESYRTSDSNVKISHVTKTGEGSED